MSLQAEVRDPIQSISPDVEMPPLVRPYASWSKRVGAHQIDMSFPAPFFIVSLVLIFTAITGDLTNGLLTSILIFLAMVMASFGVTVGFYNRCIVMGLTGQSWGKKSAGLRLVSDRTGEPIGVGKAIVREMARLVDIVVIGIGLVLPIWDHRRQTLSDKITGTVVIEAREEALERANGQPRIVEP